jgi:hypothetical protein
MIGMNTMIISMNTSNRLKFIRNNDERPNCSHSASHSKNMKY